MVKTNSKKGHAVEIAWMCVLRTTLNIKMDKNLEFGHGFVSDGLGLARDGLGQAFPSPVFFESLALLWF